MTYRILVIVLQKKGTFQVVKTTLDVLKLSFWFMYYVYYVWFKENARNYKFISLNIIIFKIWKEKGKIYKPTYIHVSRFRYLIAQPKCVFVFISGMS